MITSERETEAGVQEQARPLVDLLAAVQFLTRIPLPTLPYTATSLSRALVFFPLVGLGLGAGAGLMNRLLALHLSRTLAAGIVVAALVLITGAIHEDGLADCADAFGSHHARERTLAILHDSRIGSYGAIAIVLSLGARVLLLAAIPVGRALAFLIVAHTLSRWSALPLTLLAPARPDSGQGVRIAGRTGRTTIIVGTVLAVLITFATLRVSSFVPLVAAMTVTALSAMFYRKRLGGITGDCFGATNQLVEIAVLLCGAWTL